ncbi:hypothetical protein GGS23DRAFT_87754 [Durotheca rogersii]|uniref:uncharacterized protein n=1 Tax=Durotheca rogersii TaxID=419775 RepID=UPI00221E442A|nr:uncharacterized protein GGS23DRAFT_87754 [Durotheca rogersii]KAI5862681.1 hypothetical protein GGS23DRAFT_87754 [Durotheca rogersii]
MRLKSNHHAAAALVSVAVAATSALAEDPVAVVDPLGYTELANFSPVQRRQLNCPAGYFSCEDRGPAFAGTCCGNGQLCALDAQDQAACCPTTATCTGVAPTGSTPTPSFVSNTYFQFPYIPTSFSNQVACTSAVSQCSRNYAACVSGLSGGSSAAGGVYGVTIIVPGGGGTTVAATNAALPAPTATSVCSSLSSRACYGLQSSQCAAVASASGFIIGDGDNGAPRPTAAAAAAACVAGVVAGVGLVARDYF